MDLAECRTRRLLRFAVWIFTLLISSVDSQKLSINPPGPHILKQGKGIFLTCTASGMDDVTDPHIHWVGPDKVLISPTLERIYTEKDDAFTMHLFISDIQEADVGAYACAAEYGSVVLQKETKIVLYEEMVFADTPTFQQVDVGTETLLRCMVSGKPDPEVIWRFNKKTLPRENQKYNYTKGGLIIRDIQVADNGPYECRAEVKSQGRLESRKVQLDVLFAPEIIQGPNSTTVETGDDVMLRCKARGNPAVRYEWLLEKRVQDMVKAKIPIRHSNTDVLHVQRITKASEGRYFCRAKNNLGHTEASADVFVIVPPVIHELQEKIHVEGDSMILNCEATGDPIPKVTWYREGSVIPLEDGKQKDDVRILTETPHPGISKLVINKVNINDTGAYRCEAENGIGRDEKITTLTVQYKPKIRPTTNTQHSWPGQTVNITCRYDAVPPATISWYHHDVRLRKNSTYNIIKGKDVSILQFHVSRQTSWVYGEYRCYAKNWLGLERRTFTVIPVRTPDKPHNVTVMKIKPNNVVIKIAITKTTGRGAVQGVVVEGVKNGKSYKNKTWTFGPKETFTVKGLSPGQKYTLLIYLRNKAGIGKPSKIVIVTPSKEKFLADTSKLNEKPRMVKNRTSTTTAAPSVGIKDAVIEEPITPNNSPVGAVAGIVVTLIVILSGVIIAVWWLKFRKTKKQKEYKFGPVAAIRKTDNANTIEDDPDVMDNPIKRTIRNIEIQHPVHIQLSDKPIPNPIENRQSGEDYQFYRTAVEGANNYYKVQNGNFRPEESQPQLQPIKRNHSNGAILMIDHNATDAADYAEFTTAEIHKRDSSPSPVLPDLPLSDPHGEFKLENVDWDRVLQKRDEEQHDQNEAVTFRNGRHHYNSPAQSTSDEQSESGVYMYNNNQAAMNYEYPPAPTNEDSGVMSDSEPIHTRYSLSIEDVTNSYLQSQHASEVDIPGLLSVQDQGLQF